MRITGSKLIKLSSYVEKGIPVFLEQDTDTLRYIIHKEDNILVETLSLEQVLQIYKAMKLVATGENNV
jgi:hypothetical protein